MQNIKKGTEEGKSDLDDIIVEAEKMMEEQNQLTDKKIETDNKLTNKFVD